MTHTNKTAQEGKVGKHSYRIEEDICVCGFIGEVTEAEVEALTAQFDVIYDQYGRLLLIADLSQFTAVDAGARKRYVDWIRRRDAYASAIVGAGIVQRTITIIITNAARLVSGRTTLYSFFPDHASARVWLARQRDLLIARGGSPKSA